MQTPTTGRITDITGMGSPRPSFSAFGGMGLASPFAGGDSGEGGEKQRRFEGENKCGNFIADLRLFYNCNSFLFVFRSLYALHVRLDQVNSRLGHAVASIQVEDNPRPFTLYPSSIVVSIYTSFLFCFLQQQQHLQQPKRKAHKTHVASGLSGFGGSGGQAKRDASKPPLNSAPQKTKRSIDFKVDNANNNSLASIIPPLPHALVESIRR